MIVIQYIVGATGTLGFPIDQWNGTPMPLNDLELRLVIYLTGADLVIPGTATSGEVATLSGVVVHPAIAAFQLTPENTPMLPDLYRCALQVDDGTGFKTLSGGEYLINVRAH